ncbi:unnamed protein product [Echinostoma caproni]|uniref:Uncharacterized protein n=1 Tax=Echinostoma caproni TaxID=27848 RepID=A0A183AHS5_9TREM|nr:unnamed protein product [Echinostoma caproni]
MSYFRPDTRHIIDSQHTSNTNDWFGQATTRLEQTLCPIQLSASSPTRTTLIGANNNLQDPDEMQIKKMQFPVEENRPISSDQIQPTLPVRFSPVYGGAGISRCDVKPKEMIGLSIELNSTTMAIDKLKQEVDMNGDEEEQIR